jgi:hypothetical protein
MFYNIENMIWNYWQIKKYMVYYVCKRKKNKK